MYQANLVSIHSEGENQFVLGLNGGRDWPWLGGRREPGNRDNWVWSDGTPWGYTNWGIGEPNDLRGVEDCVELGIRNIWYWNDQPCRDLRTFVCKKGKNTGHNRCDD